MTYLFWFIAGAVFIIFELLTTSLIFASFAFGAFIAGLCGALGLDLIGQSLIFAGASVLAVLLLRPILAKRFTTKNSQGSTNVLALIGAQGTCTETITAVSGLAKVRGEVWSARTESGSIHEGAVITIVNIDGATLIVQAAK
ncbi:MAG: hypothetical protein RL196_1395 [Actinomycetota bacterium]|jgi:membrane protein implicated in regulation of membrane protease activity